MKHTNDRLNNLRKIVKQDFCEFRLLLKNIPTLLIALFIICVFLMNMLANKSISFDVDWLALDCGIIVSWFAFLAMDVITKHFGPKASTQLSVLAIIVNLAMCFVFFICASIPGVWGESFVEGSEGVINTALNNTFAGSWYVILGSTVAFFISALVNNFSNWGIGKLCKKNPDGALAYVLRTYISTAIGQLVDNFTFALIVSHFFFGWTWLQCVVCAITGMIVELVCEIVFSPLGYRICKKWKKDGVGEEYIQLVENKRLEKLAKGAEKV